MAVLKVIGWSSFRFLFVIYRLVVLYSSHLAL